MENLKKSISAVLSLVKLAEVSLEDGKISIVEGTRLAVGSFQLWQAVKDYKQLYEEYQGLTDEQKAELIEWFSAEFDLGNDDVEFVIEQVFAALLSFNSILKS